MAAVAQLKDAQLKNLVDQHDRLEREIFDLEEKIKTKKAELLRLVTDAIPAFIAQHQIAKGMKLTDGRSLDVRDFVVCKLPVDKPEHGERRKKCLAWLRKHGAADLIRNEIAVFLPVGKGTSKKANEVLKLLKKFKLEFDRSEGVHHATLSSWAKERVEDGKRIPDETDGFEMFIGQRAVIK